MKKLSLVLITLMVFFSAGISVLAETIEQKDVDVTAQYIQTAEGFNPAPVKNGEGSLTTEEGVKVSVSGAPGNARYLVICPILKLSLIHISPLIKQIMEKRIRFIKKNLY